MKLIILSDSHGSGYDILRALRKHPDADAAFFLGDGVADFLSLKGNFPDTAFFAVSGNCDIGAAYTYGTPESDQITLEGKRIFFCHGHTYRVKGGLGPLVSAAKSRGADIVLFGHTHTPTEKYIPEDTEGGALYLVNPGSISGRGAGGGVHSYALITIKGNDVLVSHGTV